MFNNNWDDFFKEEFEKEYFKKLSVFLKKEYETKTIYPPKSEVFSCFKVTDVNDVKVVILGQDPYHEINQACGMSFCVKPNVQIPKSLQNIYYELHNDLGCTIPKTGYLIKWAIQGVLLLNTVLTVEEHKANSHQNQGWEIFTDEVLKYLDSLDQPIVFLLWGKLAQKKEVLLKNPKHLVLKAAHPSPLSAYNGFFGCHHFSQTNMFLKNHNMTPIDWQI